MAKKRGRPPKKTNLIPPRIETVDLILEEVRKLHYGKVRSIDRLTELYAEYEKQTAEQPQDPNQNQYVDVAHG